MNPGFPSGRAHILKIGRRLFPLFLTLAAAFLGGFGCRTTTPMPAINLSAAGWHVAQGQAVWKPPGNRPELAGDLLVATNDNGNCFIQFSKTPFEIATARVDDGRWQVRFGTDQYSWTGRGAPSPRFVWFQLPPALAGKLLIDGWKFERSSGNLWRLQNSRTHEALSGEFFP